MRWAVRRDSQDDPLTTKHIPHLENEMSIEAAQLIAESINNLAAATAVGFIFHAFISA